MSQQRMSENDYNIPKPKVPNEERESQQATKADAKSYDDVKLAPIHFAVNPQDNADVSALPILKEDDYSAYFCINILLLTLVR